MMDIEGAENSFSGQNFGGKCEYNIVKFRYFKLKKFVVLIVSVLRDLIYICVYMLQEENLDGYGFDYWMLNEISCSVVLPTEMKDGPSSKISKEISLVLGSHSDLKSLRLLVKCMDDLKGRDH